MIQRHAAPIPSFDDVVRVKPDAPLASAPARSVRIEEVARLAGVSPITVSRALHQPHKVAEAKRLHILQVVAQTGYASNPHARALRSGQSNVVAAFVSNLLSAQFLLAVQGCTEVLEAEGYQMIVGQTAYSYEKESSMIESLRAVRPAAVLFTGIVELEENRRKLAELGIPVMETWAYPRDPIDMLVGFSNHDGGRLAAEHLAARGYRKLAFLGRQGGRGALRLRGFREAAAELGLSVALELTVDHPKTIADGRAAFTRLLDMKPDVDAVFCANDLLAIGAVFEARHRGIRVPQDMALLGFGDTDVSSELQPPLTTITVDHRELGQRAGAMLAKRLRGETLDRRIDVLDLQLILREST